MAQTFPVNGSRSLEKKMPPCPAVLYEIIIIHENTDALDTISTLLSIIISCQYWRCRKYCKHYLVKGANTER